VQGGGLKEKMKSKVEGASKDQGYVGGNQGPILKSFCRSLTCEGKKNGKGTYENWRAEPSAAGNVAALAKRQFLGYSADGYGGWSREGLKGWDTDDSTEKKRDLRETLSLLVLSRGSHLIKTLLGWNIVQTSWIGEPTRETCKRSHLSIRVEGPEMKK